jgi:hypothetical protein
MMDDLVPLKKVVHYHQLRDCAVGLRASVWPIDHPDIPIGKSGRTSVVQMFDPLTGVAETTYTRYEPGPFAEWFERREDTATRSTYEVKSGESSMTLPLTTTGTKLPKT